MQPITLPVSQYMHPEVGDNATAIGFGLVCKDTPKCEEQEEVANILQVIISIIFLEMQVKTRDA